MGAIEKTQIIAGRYEVVETLGRGGMGVVLKCRDRVLNNLVALKLLHSEVTPDLVARFQREAKAAARLNHANVVHIVDFGQTKDGQLFMVMEYLEGICLDELIATRSYLEPHELVEIVDQICRGIQHAHKQGVFHRDIKPSNVMLVSRPDGGFEAKVVDFGLAKMQTKSQQMSTGGRIFGSPAYISPEAAVGDPVDERADVYSIGCLVFEALTGKVPFMGESAFETMALRLQKSAPALETVADRPFTAELEELIGATLEKEPADRIGSVEEFRSRFEEAASKQLELDEDEEDVPSIVFRTRRLSPFSIVLIALVVLGLSWLVVDRIIVAMAAGGFQFQPTKSENFTSYRIEKREYEGGYWSRYRGYLSSEDLKALSSAFKTIEYLMLDDDHIGLDGARYFRKMKLKGLLLKKCDFSDAVLDKIADMQTLTELNLSGSRGFTDQGLEALARLPNLRRLSLKDTSIGDGALIHIAAIKPLKLLSLERCRKLTGSTLSRLSQLEQLESLSLSRTKLDLKNLEQLEKITSLRYLNLSDCRIADEVERLAGLRVDELNLSTNVVDDTGLLHLADNKRLRRLELRKAPCVTASGIYRLRQRLPRLKVIIEHGRISD